MREDTYTNTPEDAAAYERLRGRDESLYEPGGFVESRVPYCRICENGTRSNYVCGPCRRAARDQADA